MTQLRSAAEVRHPGILPVIEVGEAAGRIYFVAPLLEGETLRARLDREWPLPVADALAIARQVTAALGNIHQSGMLHKDVRPETIFLSGARAMLTDVGLSRAITRSIAVPICSARRCAGRRGNHGRPAAGSRQAVVRCAEKSCWERTVSPPPASSTEGHLTRFSRRTGERSPADIATIRRRIDGT